MTSENSRAVEGRVPSRADVYREVAALVNDLPRRYRPQDVAALLAESADQIDYTEAKTAPARDAS